MDLSLEKSRSASKRAKRESGVESQNAPAVSSSAAVAPAVLVAPPAPAVPAAPAAAASSAVQSLTLVH